MSPAVLRECLVTAIASHTRRYDKNGIATDYCQCGFRRTGISAPNRWIDHAAEQVERALDYFNEHRLGVDSNEETT